MSAHSEDDRIRELLAPLNDIAPVRRNVRRPSRRRRLLLALAVGICVLGAGSAAIAAGLGAFSGTAVTDLNACEASTPALTTASGARVLTGQTDAGISCLAYKDANGTIVRTAGEFGGTPVGDALALKALDTASHAYVIAAIVPSGYDTLSIGTARIPIKNRVFVIDPKLAASPGSLSGPAGTTSINLGALAAP